MKATATYSPTKWDEKTYEQISPTSKMTRASVEFAFKGQMEGLANVEYLMFYEHSDEMDPHKSEATYVGLIRFNGKLDGKGGSFVMEDRGSFKGSQAISTLSIIPGSGTEQLKGIQGTGKYLASPQSCHCDLDYELR